MRTALFLWCVLSLGAISFASDPVTEPNRSDCTVTTQFVHDVYGTFCRWRNEVMVGIRSMDPFIIRCAELQIRCQETAEPKDEQNTP